MDSITFLHYPDSLSNVDQDYGLSWEDKENPSYKHNGSRNCLPCSSHTVPGIGERLDSERQRTVITESMSVTASDEEKLQLLTKNTELRGMNAELMKLNQQWDEIYRSTTQRMHHTAQALQAELQSLHKHSEKLSLKLEHEQNKREFYESSLIQEMKKNQQLQEYVRRLERKLHSRHLEQEMHKLLLNLSPFLEHVPSFKLLRAYLLDRHLFLELLTDIPNTQPDFVPSSSSFAMTQHLICKSTSAHFGDAVDLAQKSEHQLTAMESCGHQHKQDLRAATTEQDIVQLKEQLQALKCQTEIYAADYKTEHTDHQRIKTENEKLRKKEKETREHMLLLKEQLKVYEDDFRKERCDKQVLQRLLKRRDSTNEPILVHRCNNLRHQEKTFGNPKVLTKSERSQEKSGRDVQLT
ncbi:uncharacterized protein PAF06_000203 [Gastrophryne carolinensis]